MQDIQNPNENQVVPLLTKREYYAGLVMASFMTDPEVSDVSRTAFFAVHAADALLTELARAGADA